MINGNDLKLIDFFLTNQLAICNQPEQHKRLITELRQKIADELGKIEVKVVRREE